jgi:hypothetical protein
MIYKSIKQLLCSTIPTTSQKQNLCLLNPEYVNIAFNYSLQLNVQQQQCQHKNQIVPDLVARCIGLPLK